MISYQLLIFVSGENLCYSRPFLSADVLARWLISDCQSPGMSVGGGSDEPVRLPGMVNIELEAVKLDPERLRLLQLDVPLQISVGLQSSQASGHSGPPTNSPKVIDAR